MFKKLPVWFSRISPKIDYSKDYYQILKVPQNAQQDQIRIHYYQLAKKYHPDSVTSNPEKYTRVQEAFKILSDLEYKQKYDLKRNKPEQTEVLKETNTIQNQQTNVPIENLTDCEMKLVIKCGSEKLSYEFKEKELAQKQRNQFEQAAFEIMRSFSINKEEANNAQVGPFSIVVKVLEICALIATIVITKKK